MKKSVKVKILGFLSTSIFAGMLFLSSSLSTKAQDPLSSAAHLRIFDDVRTVCVYVGGTCLPDVIVRPKPRH